MTFADWFIFTMICCGVVCLLFLVFSAWVFDINPASDDDGILRVLIAAGIFSILANLIYAIEFLKAVL